MTAALVFEQLLNGLQYGVMLFLMAAGLTLVLGIMNLVNLAHGSLYMVGAYLAVAGMQATGSYLAGVVLGFAGTSRSGLQKRASYWPTAASRSAGNVVSSTVNTE